MASVKKFPGTKYWTGCYRDASDRRRQKSTHVENEAEALALAQAWERMATAARTAQLHDDRAQRFLAECRAITGSTNTHPTSAGDYLRDWVDRMTPRLKPNSARKYKDTIARFLAAIGTKEVAALSAVTPVDVVQWRDAMLKGGRTKKTANVALGILNQAFTEARTLRACSDNPCTGLKLPGADVGNVRRQPFTLAQCSALLDAVDDEWRSYLLTLALAGPRQQEAAKLLWEQVNFTAETITFIRGKQRDKPHVVPMHPQLKDELSSAHAKAASVFVFPTIAAMRGQLISKRFRQQILPRIGIKQAYGGRPGGKVPARYTLHSLRHSLAGWADAVGMTAARRRDLLGHESRMINERYTHTNIEEIRADLAKIKLAPAQGRRAAT